MASPSEQRLARSLAAYRLASARYVLFDGGGAARLGGRWNSPGGAVIYASLSFAGAVLEHLARTNIGVPHRDLSWIEIVIPAGVRVEEVRADEHRRWDDADYRVSRALGDAWIERGATVALIVPSRPGAPVERNVLLNPAHRDIGRVTHSVTRRFEWDPRLAEGFEERPR